MDEFGTDTDTRPRSLNMATLTYTPEAATEYDIQMAWSDFAQLWRKVDFVTAMTDVPFPCSASGGHTTERHLKLKQVSARVYSLEQGAPIAQLYDELLKDIKELTAYLIQKYDLGGE